MAPAMFYLTLFCGVVPAVSDLMRAERDAIVELHLGAAGELHSVGPLGETVNAADLLRNEKNAIEKANNKQNDMCDLDFPLGQPSADHCLQSDTQILDRAQCHEAARENLGDDKQSFLLDSNWFMVHPQGCFMEECGSSMQHKLNTTEHGDTNLSTITGGCYYFNPTGAPPPSPTPAGFSGTPVCERPKFLNATAPNLVEGGCLSGYERIYNEDVCHKVGGCLSDPDASDFRVGIKNYSQHFDFPRGCFIATDGEVYYNPIVTDDGSAIPVHSGAVTGMPLCGVEGKVGNSLSELRKKH